LGDKSPKKIRHMRRNIEIQGRQARVIKTLMPY